MRGTNAKIFGLVFMGIAGFLVLYTVVPMIPDYFIDWIWNNALLLFMLWIAVMAIVILFFKGASYRDIDKDINPPTS